MHTYVEESSERRSHSSISENDFLHFNVCGMKYETLKSRLERFPMTLLGNPEARKKYYVPCKKSYFFDRHRACFEAILYFYQSGGLLVRPPNIPMTQFATEVNFFRLGKENLLALQREEGYIPEEDDEEENSATLPKVSSLQRKIWILFEFPESSLAARILALWSVSVITLSIMVFCMETMPVFQQELPPNITSVSTSRGVYRQPWFGLELSCIIWFTVEYAIRFSSSPDKRKFLKSFLNCIDLIAVLPYFIVLPINSGESTPLSVLRVCRLVRVFRIFKLSRHSLGLQILGHTLRASVRELLMLIFFLILSIILFSSTIFYAENDGTYTENGVVRNGNPMFGDMTDAFWYSLVTMTTVGYGDIYPRTTLGKIIGSLCAVSGVLTIALPVPVIVSNFEFFYKRDRLNSSKRKALLPQQNELVTSNDDNVLLLPQQPYSNGNGIMITEQQ